MVRLSDSTFIQFNPKRLLRFSAVRERVPVTAPTIMAWVRDRIFPESVQLNPGHINSPIACEDEVEEWLATRPRGFSPGLNTLKAREARRRNAAQRRLKKPTKRYAFRRGDGRSSRTYFGT